MSGGTIGNYDDIRVREFAEELEAILQGTGTSWSGDVVTANFSPVVMRMLAEDVLLIKKAANRMKLIDYLFSFDIGEEGYKNGRV